MTGLSHLPLAPDSLIERRALLDRVDTKFILRSNELPDLLGRLNGKDYGAAQHPGGGVFGYENLYFDTADRALLRAHHRGQRPRYKVRMRHHLSRNMSFFELKQKRPNGVTTKERIPIAFKSDALEGQASALLIHRPRLTSDLLEPAMRIGFERAMLVGLETPERISIDSNIWFRDEQSEARLDDLVIVEVKQARFAARSPIMRALRSTRALQLRVSKYVTGAQLIWPSIRLNRYRNRLRMLRRRIA